VFPAADTHEGTHATDQPGADQRSAARRSGADTTDVRPVRRPCPGSRAAAYSEAMGDDWRVEVDLEEHGGLSHLLDSAREHRVARESRERLTGPAVVTVDEGRLFAYTESEAQAREAERILCDLAAERGLGARATVTRWHPEEQRWEPVGDALPRTAVEHEAERATRDAEQAAEAAERRYAEWEVRVELADHDQAAALAARLASEGLPVVCRSRYVVVAASSEDEATSVADRIRTEAPGALQVVAEGSAAVAMDEVNPFSVISGRWRRL
jgi:hypothetical protein